MTGRENRRARREAERKARKHVPHLAPETPPSSPEPPAPQPHPETVAYVAESAKGADAHRSLGGAPNAAPVLHELLRMRAKAHRELNDEFGREFMAQAHEVSGRLARRIGINRRNAQLSTGPRTEEGKLASSRNSLKHGLSTGILLIPGEESAEFEALRDALRREHQPADTTEQLLVDGIAQSHWLLQRALRYQNECFTAEGVDEKRLALFIRYGTTHERAFHKALSALLRLQKDRRKAQLSPNHGFVSQKPTELASVTPLAAPQGAFVSQTNSSVSLHAANFGEMNAPKSSIDGKTIPQAA